MIKPGDKLTTTHSKPYILIYGVMVSALLLLLSTTWYLESASGTSDSEIANPVQQMFQLKNNGIISMPGNLLPIIILDEPDKMDN